MAKIIIAGDAMVIESAHTMDEIKTLENHYPKALALVDEDKNEIFKVGTTTGKGSINKYGASFGSIAHNGTGKATITMEIPAGVEDAKKYAEEKVGVAINHLKKVEAQFEAALASVKAEMDEVRSSITVVQ